MVYYLVSLYFDFGTLLISQHPTFFFSCQIERFINSPEAQKNPPDYQDILKQVLHANERYKLCLSRKQLNQMAKEAFRDIGTRMQERRHLDLVYNFGSHLTDSYKHGKALLLIRCPVQHASTKRDATSM